MQESVGVCNYNFKKKTYAINKTKETLKFHIDEEERDRKDCSCYNIES